MKPKEIIKLVANHYELPEDKVCIDFRAQPSSEQESARRVILHLLRERGMTYADVGKALNVSRSIVCRDIKLPLTDADRKAMSAIKRAIAESEINNRPLTTDFRDIGLWD